MDNSRLLVLAVVSSLLLQQTAANEFFGGDPVSNITLGDADGDSQAIGSGFSTSIITDNLVIPKEGRIRLLVFRSGSTNANSSIFLQAWRLVAGNEYKLTRNKKISNVKSGLNEVAVNWIVPAGDIVGLSCNRNCPVMRGPSDPDYKSKVSMSDDLSDFVKYSTRIFNDHELMGKLALMAVLEINGPLDPVETTPVIDLTVSAPRLSSTTTRKSVAGESSSGESAATTKSLQSVDSPAGQTSTIGIWWILIAAVAVITLLSLALVFVAACRFRRERTDLSKQLVSRSPSGLSQGRTLSGAGSDVNTLARRNPGLSGADEIVVVNEQEVAHSHSGDSENGAAQAIASVSPDGRRAEPTVVFDNGVGNTGCPTPPLPPPPLHA